MAWNLGSPSTEPLSLREIYIHVNDLVTFLFRTIPSLYPSSHLRIIFGWYPAVVMGKVRWPMQFVINAVAGWQLCKARLSLLEFEDLLFESQVLLEPIYKQRMVCGAGVRKRLKQARFTVQHLTSSNDKFRIRHYPFLGVGILVSIWIAVTAPGGGFIQEKRAQLSGGNVPTFFHWDPVNTSAGSDGH